MKQYPPKESETTQRPIAKQAKKTHQTIETTNIKTTQETTVKVTKGIAHHHSETTQELSNIRKRKTNTSLGPKSKQLKLTSFLGFRRSQKTNKS